MINPKPVQTRTSPYSSGGSKSSLPKALSARKKNPLSRWKKIFFISLLFLIGGSGTYVYAYINSAKNNLLVDHLGDSSSALALYTGNTDISLLKKAGDGRFNLLIVGIGGENHPGGQLTDSIQILSIDPLNKKVAITSIPRDLYVNVPKYGYTKVNAAYTIGEQAKKDNGGYVMRQAIGEVTGVEITNFLMIDFSGAKDLIDKIGGVDINVPKAINDPFFPDDAQKGYAPFKISAGQQHMNGATALKYARSRETTSDFDRSARQQLIIEAIKAKTLSAGTLANPSKVLGLIDVLGKHVRTDLTTDEIKALVSLYKDTGSNKATTSVLDTSPALGLLTASSGTAAGYISYPVLGQGKYNDIHDWFQKNNQDPYLVREAPTVTVVAGTGATAKQVEGVVASLKDYGFNAQVGTAKAPGGVTATAVYSNASDKPVSSNYLGSYFSITAQKGHPLNSGSNFEVVYLPPKK